MPTQSFAITVEQGATFTLPMVYNVPADAPQDLSAWVANMDVRDSGGSLLIHLGSAVAPTGLRAAIVPGGNLVAGQTYFYRLSAIIGGEGAPSNEASATPTGTSLSVLLQWTAVPGASGYRLYRGTQSNGQGTLVATIGSGAATSFTDVGQAGVSQSPPTANTATLPAPALNSPSTGAAGALTPTQTYYFVLTAVTALGETTASNEVGATGGGSVTLTWPAATAVTGYNLYRGTAAGGEDTLVAELPAASTTFTDDGATSISQSPPATNAASVVRPAPAAVLNAGGALPADIEVFYVVTALTLAGETAASVEVNATPTGTDLKVVLSWLQVAGATGYRIYRSDTTSVYTSPCLLTTIASGATLTYTDDGSIIILATGAPPGTSTAFVPPPVSSACSTSTTGGALEPRTWYYKITAITAAGETTGSAQQTQATTGSTSSVTVNWSAVAGATGYNVYAGVAAGAQDTLIGSVGPGQTSFVDYGATASPSTIPPTHNTAAIPPPVQGTPTTATIGGALATGTWYYKVTALTANGETTAPLEKSALATGASAVTLSWSSVAGATGYNVYRGSSPGAERTLIGTASASATSFVDYGAGPATVYAPGTILLGGTSGTIVLELPAATTLLLPPGAYVYDIFLDAPGGIKTKLLTGTFTVVAAITAVP